MIATTVQNVGNLQGISIPTYLLTALNWRLGDELVIDAKDDCLIIKHARTSNRKSINDLFEGFKGDYVPHEIDWGKAEGREGENS